MTHSFTDTAVLFFRICNLVYLSLCMGGGRGGRFSVLRYHCVLVTRTVEYCLVITIFLSYVDFQKNSYKKALEISLKTYMSVNSSVSFI